MNDHYDRIIIGKGAGGGTLSNKLAPRGLRIQVLERGPFLPREKVPLEDAAFARLELARASSLADTSGRAEALK